MANIKITDLNASVLFEELSEEELLTVMGGITATQLSNNLYLAGAGLGGAAVISGAFGDPIGLGVAAGLGLGAAAFSGLGAIAAMYAR